MTSAPNDLSTSPAADAHAWLESQRSQMVADLIQLANQNTFSSNLKGLEQAADWLADWFSVEHASLSRIALPPRHFISEIGAEQAVESAPALQWQVRNDAEQKVLLGIHYDTVYSLVHQPSTCQLIDENRLLGPGVADAKGGIIVMRYALAALEHFQLLKRTGWTCFLNPDEEIGSPSSGAVWTQLAHEHDFGLLFEPSMPSGALVAERKGSGSFSIVVRGRAAHAGRDFASGRNAVALASHLATRLDALNGRRSGTTINIGQIGGGGPVNVVPDLAIVKFNVRVEDSESQDWFSASLSDILAEADTREGFVTEIYGGFHAPPKTLNVAQRNLMNAIESIGQDLWQQPIHWMASGGVCDGNRLAASGCPNIDTLGPVGDRIHSPDEWVDIASLVRRAQLVVELMVRFDSGKLSVLNRPTSRLGS